MEATQRRNGVETAASSTPAPAPTLTVAAVARRLGVAPPTLRTWDRRYGLGPSAHTAGAHRRYSPADVARLMVMRRLTLEGVSPADAAKIAVAAPVSDDGRPMHTPADGYDLSFLEQAGELGETVRSEPFAPDPDDPRYGRQEVPPGFRAVQDDDPDLWSESSVEYPAAVPGRGEMRWSDRLERTEDQSGTGSQADPGSQPDPGSQGDQLDPAAETASWPGILRSVGSERSTPGGGRVVAMPDATPQNRGLARAAMSLDTYETHRLLSEAVRRNGVVPTWDSMIMPVLRALGERTRATGDGIDVEHAFSEVILGVMRAVVFSVPPPRTPVTVLLACADSESHSLPLHAVAAALTERGIPSRMLGSGLPPSAVAASVRRTGPSVIMLYARMSGADATDTEAYRRQRPAPTVILAGPGWQPDTIPPYARTAMTLTESIDEVLLALHA
jgi:MerR family transcriptional regulator, light-induced transcriptional regulator